MTATERLRELLDERGVEWSGTSFSTPAKGHPTNTSLGEEHHEATFIEYHDGNVLRLFDLTPEQAIEATLGSDLKAENEKLRELVLDYEELAAKLCDARECGGCPFDSERTICEHMRLIARVGELGVDDG